MTNAGQRLCVTFSTQRMRVAVDEHRSGSGWVVRVVQPSLHQAVAIRSQHHDTWDSARDAFLHEIVTIGDAIMRDISVRLKQAIAVWKNGRVGVRPRSGAAFNQVLVVSANIVDVALPCARAIRRLIDSGGLPAAAVPDHRWLVCALSDIQNGWSPEEAARRLAASVRE